MQDKTIYYKVAEHVFSVEASDAILSQMSNYAPFVTDAVDTPTFSLAVLCDTDAPAYTEETRQEEEGQAIICGRTAEGLPTFDFWLFGKCAGILVCEKDFRKANLFIQQGREIPTLVAMRTKEQSSKCCPPAFAGMTEKNTRMTEEGAQKVTHLDTFAVNNSLMVLYSLATANLQTALFHAAVIRNKERGYLFLGKSGTGKSTHARLWLQYNKGSTLLNDDNPVVRLFKGEDGKISTKVYGSPWSGKTPCYRNEVVDVGGFVLLSQAPFNKISRLKGVAAYAALVPCISGMRWDKEIANGIHQTENALASHVPVWYLECLPDEAAAKLCQETIA